MSEREQVAKIKQEARRLEASPLLCKMAHIIFRSMDMMLRYAVSTKVWRKASNKPQNKRLRWQGTMSHFF